MVHWWDSIFLCTVITVFNKSHSNNSVFSLVKQTRGGRWESLVPFSKIQQLPQWRCHLWTSWGWYFPLDKHCQNICVTHFDTFVTHAHKGYQSCMAQYEQQAQIYITWMVRFMHHALCTCYRVALAT